MLHFYKTYEWQKKDSGFQGPRSAIPFQNSIWIFRLLCYTVGIFDIWYAFLRHHRLTFYLCFILRPGLDSCHESQILQPQRILLLWLSRPWDAEHLGKMKWDLKQRRDTIKRELLLLGDDVPQNEFERNNMLMQTVSRVSRTFHVSFHALKLIHS